MASAAGARPRDQQGTIVEIRTTFSRRENADACARQLIDGRLAACVQIDGPIASIYRWKGVVEAAEEFRCTCKTSPHRAEACVAAISLLHEYETPEVIITVAQASPAYAEWVHAAVETEPHGGAVRDET